MLAFTWHKDNTSTIRLSGLYDELEGQYVSDAQVRIVEILDANGDTPAGIVLPVTLAYETGTNGSYAGSMDPPPDAEHGDVYFAAVEVESGSARASFDFELKVYARKSTPAR